ncbi:MAG: AAA family ATPase [Planctomycetes bacterium]|nr:AAA family ATPase [Planctomycetota bacterium]
MTAEALLHELADPACYPGAAARGGEVQLIQTHLSVVCIVGERVYKLKKAVKLPFVDFSTLAARQHACDEEVRLNRRLCRDVYLGTVELRRTPAGLRFGPPDATIDGELVDHAVLMRRLPQQRMLDELLAAHDVTAAQLAELARHVARFHDQAERSPRVRELGDPQRLAGFAADNFTELAAVPGQPVPKALLTRLAARSEAKFRHRLPTLQRRAASGRVVDGHGDLHARNVCMTSPPTVYDCIEFEPAFRCGDVATEVAFLAMDLRYRGAPALARAFVDAYVLASGDTQLPELMPLLCSYRAMVRAKVAAMAAAEAELDDTDRDGARSSCRRHARLAAALLLEAPPPRWLVLCGPPASGKSGLCRALGEQLQWPTLATDVLRKQLAGLAPDQPATAAHYTPEFSRLTYGALFEHAAQQTAAGAAVVLLDGNFATPALRAEARAAAAQTGTTVSFVFVNVDAATAKQRAAARAAAGGDASDADAEVTARLHQRFVAPKVTADDVDRPGAAVDQLLARCSWTQLIDDAAGVAAARRARRRRMRRAYPPAGPTT